MRNVLLSLSASAVLSLSACGGSSSAPVAQVASGDAAASAAATPAASTTPGPSETDLDRFFTALASDESAKIKPVLKLAAPGSVAYAYADYLYLRALAGESAGYEADPQSIERAGAAWRACPKTKKQGSCITWDNVKATGDLIANYTANGKPLDGRIVLGNGKKYHLGSIATAQVAVSYRSVQSNSTFVVVKIHNGSQKAVIADDTAYQTPKGAQIGTSDGIAGPTSFLPHAEAYVLLDLPNAPLGGHLYLDMFTTSGPADGGSAMLPTK